MENLSMSTPQRDSGIFAALNKTPPHFLFGLMLFGLLWLASEYLVTRKEYEKDQAGIRQALEDMRQDSNDVKNDIKKLLERSSK
jgi:hypothetical protein